MIDPLLVWIALACTATLFAHAAIAKAMDLALFEQHLAAFGVPQTLLGIAARAVPAAEAFAALLMFTPWRTAGAALAASLLLLYGALMASHVARGRTPDCGCGGEPLPVSWVLVLRNAALAAVAALAAAPMAARAMGSSDFFVVVAALLLATLLYAALHQVLRHRAVPSQRALFRRT
jgi:uncharacterized membrane protein YphA (DoxX/SURF4 family)